MATREQERVWTQNDARAAHRSATQELETFLADPTPENEWYAVQAQNSASDAAHCALHAAGLVEWVVQHKGPNPYGETHWNTSYSAFTPSFPAQ